MSNPLPAMPNALRWCTVIALAAAPLSAALAAPGAPDPAAQSDIHTLDTIQVHGTRIDTVEIARSQVPGGVYLLDEQDLRQRAVNNLADALRYVPGVLAESNAGGDDMVLSIRGSNLNALAYDNAGVALFQDGLPVTAADGSNHNRMLDPRTAHNVIVANGINALTYGASDLGGAIDFISRTARNGNPREVFVGGGSHGRIEADVSAGGVSGALDGMVSLDATRFGGYRAHSRQYRRSLHANGGWRVADDFRVRVFASHVDDRQQLPGALTQAQYDADPWQAEPSYALGNHQLNVKSDRLAAKARWDIDARSRLTFGVSWENQRLFHPIVDVFVPAGPGPDAPLVDVFSLLVNTRQRTTGGMLRYQLRTDAHDLLAGLDLAHTAERGGNYANDAGRRGALQDVVRKRADSATLFAVDRWRFAPDWTLVYGAQGTVTRLDDEQIDGVGDAGNAAPRNQRNRFTSLNPRLGVIRVLGGDSEAYASVGRVYQSPNNFELDNARRERGAGAELEAMHGVSWEAGLRGATATAPDAASWHWNVSAWRERIHDEIFSVDDPDAPGISLTSNIAHTIHAGLEVLVGARFPVGDGSRIEPLVSASWNDFRFDHDPSYGDNRLPSAPRFAVHGEVMYRNADGFHAGPTFDWVGSRYVDFTNTRRVGGYAIAGLRAGIERGRWELFAEARNLFDRRYAAAVQVVNQAAPGDAILNPGAPRSVYVGVRMDY